MLSDLCGQKQRQTDTNRDTQNGQTDTHTSSQATGTHTCAPTHLGHLWRLLVVPLPPQPIVAEDGVWDVPERVHGGQGDDVEPHVVRDPVLGLLAHLREGRGGGAWELWDFFLKAF